MVRIGDVMGQGLRHADTACRLVCEEQHAVWYALPRLPRPLLPAHLAARLRSRERWSSALGVAMYSIARAIARKAICAPFEVRTTTLPLSARVSLRTSLTTGAAHHLVASSAAMTTIGATIGATTAVMAFGAIAGLGATHVLNRAETSHLLVGRLASL